MVFGILLGVSLSLFLSALLFRNGRPVFPILYTFIAVAIALRIAREGFTEPPLSGYPPDSATTLHSAVSGFSRFVLSIVGGLLLLLSLLLAVAAVSDLPGLFSSGALDPQMPNELTNALGTSNWPRLFSEIGVSACVITALLSLQLLFLARRAHGGSHMVRTIFGMLALFAAAISIGRALPDWADFVPQSSGGATLDWVFQRVDMHRAIWAAIVAALGYTILLWPPRHQLSQAPVANVGAGK